MITIARNRAIDVVRKPTREISSDDSYLCSFPSDRPTALDEIEISEDRACYLMQRLDVLKSLDPERRNLIISAYIRGESRKQLAQRYGVPVNTIKTWIRRALLQTRATLPIDAL
jgi:RNA polymerase sigma-70 factor, ECF subfamily